MIGKCGTMLITWEYAERYKEVFVLLLILFLYVWNNFKIKSLTNKINLKLQYRFGAHTLLLCCEQAVVYMQLHLFC